jgi:hypothetical protein
MRTLKGGGVRYSPWQASFEERQLFFQIGYSRLQIGFLDRDIVASKQARRPASHITLPIYSAQRHG